MALPECFEGGEAFEFVAALFPVGGEVVAARGAALRAK
jgi:hypothetical protein